MWKRFSLAPLLVCTILAAASVSKPTPVLWRDPGDVERLDLAWGEGGAAKAPKPPFTFVEENLSGSNPKVKVTDSTGALFNIKFGEEAYAETFATRIVWAAGYVVESTYFLKEGHIENVGKLTRARKNVDSRGNFKNGRFQRWDKDYKFLSKPGWTWTDNPFVGTHELAGLKIIMMLMSNWDNKDARDQSRDSNTAILEHTEGGQTQWLYFVSDWGASMGKWGGYATRSKWDCKGYAEQTPKFVQGVRNGYVGWAYRGQHTQDEVTDVSVPDVKWLMQYLGRLTDQQIRDALAASGATPEELTCFSQSFRDRIDQLRLVSRTDAAPAGQQ